MTAQPLPARAKPEECTFPDPKSCSSDLSWSCPFFGHIPRGTFSTARQANPSQPGPSQRSAPYLTPRVLLDLSWTYCLGLGPRDQFRTTFSTAVQANPPLPSQARIHLSLPKEFSWTSSSYPLDLWSPTDTHWSFIYFEQEFSSPAKNYLPIWPFPTMPTKNYHKNGFLG